MSGYLEVEDTVGKYGQCDCSVTYSKVGPLLCSSNTPHSRDGEESSRYTY